MAIYTAGGGGAGGEERPEGPAALEALRRELLLRTADALQGARRWISTGFSALDEATGGGLPRGRLSEVVGPPSSGRTALLLAAAAAATRRGEVVAWIDAHGALDAPTAAAAGLLLSRLLWVRPRAPQAAWAAADIVLGTGGFALVVLDLGAPPAARTARERTPPVWPRLARGAERSGAAVALLAERRQMGTFAALSLELSPGARRWRGLTPAHSVLTGAAVRCLVARSKLGRPERWADVQLGEGAAVGAGGGGSAGGAGVEARAGFAGGEQFNGNTSYERNEGGRAGRPDEEAFAAGGPRGALRSVG